MSDTYAAAYEAVLSVYHITKYRNYFNGNLKFPGLPGDGGEYHAIKPEVKVGISSSSTRKEGAWEFVRTLLTEDHQMSCMMLPIHRRAFDKVTQAAVEGKSIWTWIYEDGKATKEDVDAAVAAAWKAFPEWKTTDKRGSRTYLRKNRRPH
mgnify:CR=1 FL=1